MTTLHQLLEPVKKGYIFNYSHETLQLVSTVLCR